MNRAPVGGCQCVYYLPEMSCWDRPVVQPTQSVSLHGKRAGASGEKVAWPLFQHSPPPTAIVLGMSGPCLPIYGPVVHELAQTLLSLLAVPVSPESQGSEPQVFTTSCAKKFFYVLQINLLLISPSAPCSNIAGFAEQQFYIQLIHHFPDSANHNHIPLTAFNSPK